MDYSKIRVIRDMVLFEVVAGEEKTALENKHIIEVKEGRPTGVIIGRVKKTGPDVIDVSEEDVILLPARAMNNPDAKLILVQEHEILAVQE